MQLRFETPINLMQDMIDWIIGDDGLIDKNDIPENNFSTKKGITIILSYVLL